MTFGDIFKFQDSEFVYIGETVDFVYAARIHNKDITVQLLNGRKSAERKGSPNLLRATIWSFIVLDTEEYRNLACHHGSAADTDVKQYFHLVTSIIGQLNKNDMEVLKKDILEFPCNKEIRKIVAELEI